MVLAGQQSRRVRDLIANAVDLGVAHDNPARGEWVSIYLGLTRAQRPHNGALADIGGTDQSKGGHVRVYDRQSPERFCHGLELIHGTILLGAIRPCFMAVFGLELRK